MTKSMRKRIAIIGTGISGLGAASLLYPHHNITIYEKNATIGGHSRTVDVTTKDGVVPVDTGFIVFNKRNYPLLTRLFEHLQVPITESDMSFGASIDKGWLEYGTRKPADIFAQKSSFLKPSFWRMIADILKFNAKAQNYLLKDPAYTLGQCLDDLEAGPWFRAYYLLAMGGAIWSTPPDNMLAFPACTFVRFFENHGLLTLNNHPQWYTVRGGSRAYIQRLIAPLQQHIHLNRGVRKVQRTDHGAVVHDIHGQQDVFDEVVFACHADEALAMIVEPSAMEQKILSAFRYQPNRAVLHSDTTFMPQRRQAWASWVYLSEDRTDKNPNVSLTYWMNNLQPLPTSQPLFVTLNPCREPDPHHVYDDHIFHHPVFDAEAIISQNRLDDLQGRNRFWFCGAYQRYGFHEDGLGSAVRMAQRMGIDPPW